MGKHSTVPGNHVNTTLIPPQMSLLYLLFGSKIIQLHYFITFSASSVFCKPGLPHQLSELELVDWYENQHIMLQ